MLWKAALPMMWIQKLVQREEGQALAEYSLVLALIFLVAVAAVTALGLAVVGFFEPLPNAFGG